MIPVGAHMESIQKMTISCKNAPRVVYFKNLIFLFYWFRIVTLFRSLKCMCSCRAFNKWVWQLPFIKRAKQKHRSILRHTLQSHLTTTNLVGREDTCSVHSHWLYCSVYWNVTRDWDSQLDPSIHRADLLSLSPILLYICVKALFKSCLEQWSNISLSLHTPPPPQKSCTTWRWISGRKNLSELEAFWGKRILWTCMKVV